MKQPINIILLGDPASGKATHGAVIAKKFHLYDLDMGRELRKLQKSTLWQKAGLDKTTGKGKLAPTDFVRHILYTKIRATPKTRGILFNGTPKMIGEAKLVANWLRQEKRRNPLVIYLTIPFAETIRRITSRKEYFKGKYSKRPDDNNQALKNRISYYKKNISGVVKFFKAKYEFRKISSLGTVPVVKKKLLHIISQYENRFN